MIPLTSRWSFVAEYPKISISLLCVVIAKATISVFTPLSEDFLTTGVLVAPTDLWAILRTNGAYLLWMLLVKGIYTAWQLIPIEHPPVEAMVGLWYFFPSLSSQLLIFMLKLPLIIFDVLCALMIYKIALWYTSSHVNSLTASALWLLNPYVTLTTEMFGAYDVIVVFFFLTSLLYLLEEDYIKSAAAFIVSMFLKPYPLLLLPIFIIVLVKQKRSRGALKFTLVVIPSVSAIPLALILCTSRLESLSGLLYYYFKKGISFFAGFILESYVSKTGWIPIYIGTTLIFSMLYLFIMYEFWESGKKSLLDASLGFCLVIFAFSFWHPQLLLWVLPLITLDYVLNRTPKLYPVLFIATAFLFELIYFSFYFTSHGHSVFFVPNYNSELLLVSNAIYPLYKDPDWIGPIAILFRSTFIGVCIYYLMEIGLRNLKVVTAHGQRDS